MAWTTPRTWTSSELVTAAIMNSAVRDDLNILKTELSDLGIVQRAQYFRGVLLRTHPDNDVAASKVSLLAATEVVLSDGARYTGLTLPLVADITVAGGGGLDTGAEAASTWYEIYLIGKSSTKAAADLKLLLHKGTAYAADQSQTTDDTSEKLRQGAADRVKLAQGFQATAKPIDFVDIKLTKVGAPTGNIYYTIETDTAGSPSGAVQATSDKLDVSLVSTTAQVIRVPFRSPFTPTAATQYHLVLQGDYAASGANYVQWQGNTGGGYANGSAKKYDGTNWAAAVGPVDFYFKIYVTTASAALTFPAGYDESCLLGYVYNDSGSAFGPFIALDKRVKFAALPVAVSGGAATISTILDISALVPAATVSIDAWELSNSALSNVYVASVFSSGVAYGVYWDAPFAGSFQDVGEQVPVQYQHIYYKVGAGTGFIYVRGFSW